jgi:hypothetical protein
MSELECRVSDDGKKKTYSKRVRGELVTIYVTEEVNNE